MRLLEHREHRAETYKGIRGGIVDFIRGTLRSYAFLLLQFTGFM